MRAPNTRQRSISNRKFGRPQASDLPARATGPFRPTASTDKGATTRVAAQFQARQWRRRLTFGACCNVAFGLDTAILPEDSHAGLFPPGAPTFLTMVTDLKAMTPDAAPPGRTLVHALATGDRARELFALDDGEIARRTVEEMRRFFPTMPQSPLFARVYRWPEAICLALSGMLKEMHDLRTGLARRASRRGWRTLLGLTVLRSYATPLGPKPRRLSICYFLAFSEFASWTR